MRILRAFVRLFVLTLAVLVLMSAVAGWAQGPQIQKPDTIIATDYPDLNAAIDAARILRVGKVYMPAGTYKVSKTLNLTDWYWEDLHGPNDAARVPVRQPAALVLEGAGHSTVIEGNTGNDPVIDMTGSSRIALRNFAVQTPLEGGKWQPGASAGILMARKASVVGGPDSAGHHSLEGVLIQGNYSVASVMSYCSEENTFYHCVFINNGGDAFIFSGENREGITSPYQKLGRSSNVVVTFYSGWFWSGKKDSVGLRVTSGSAVYMYGGFFGTFGESFAAIYLNNCDGVRISSARREGTRGHFIYAAGVAKNVMIDSCSSYRVPDDCPSVGGEVPDRDNSPWLFFDPENILYQDSVPDARGPHRFATKSIGRATNWILEGNSFMYTFRGDPSTQYDPEKTLPEGRTVLRFESLQDSRAHNNEFLMMDRTTGKLDNTKWPLVMVEGYSRGNTFELPYREGVALRGDSRANMVTATADDKSKEDDRLASAYSPGSLENDSGRRRIYVDPDSSGSLMNFGVVDVYRLSNPRKGDFAMHDGTRFTDGKARLAMFDGKEWLFFDPSPKKE